MQTLNNESFTKLPNVFRRHIDRIRDERNWRRIRSVRLPFSFKIIIVATNR